ncbi:MAG: hypothetical protein Q8O88_05745 [bacterium]|nr:hypothetical protein [bacterium]
MNWLLQNIIGIIGIVVGGFIAYHVYFLSKRLDSKDKLVHRDAVRNKVESVISEIRRGINRDSELVNIKKYFTHYPNNLEKNKDGYTVLKGELKGLSYDGVEFFCGVKEVYRKSDGTLTLRKSDDVKREKFNLLETGLVPYDWIEYVDTHGDEFSFRPQFFTHFNGMDKSPYKYLKYYKDNDNYDKRNDPIEMQFTFVNVVR